MKAKLKKMDHPRFSRNGDSFFQRIYFMLDDGRFAITDLVSSYRNFKWWEPVIKAGIGTTIGGVFLKDDHKGFARINADSQIFIIQQPLVKEESPKELFRQIRDARDGGPSIFIAESQTRPGKNYEITDHYGVMACSCPDYKYMRRNCKHIRVIERQRVIDKKKQQELIPKLF